jgi:hypothetical protein
VRPAGGSSMAVMNQLAPTRLLVVLACLVCTQKRKAAVVLFTLDPGTLRRPNEHRPRAVPRIEADGSTVCD